MRGKVAKNLRKFAKTDMPDAPWESYLEVQTSHHSANKSVALAVGCQKFFYRQLKKVWKAF